MEKIVSELDLKEWMDAWDDGEVKRLKMPGMTEHSNVMQSILHTG